MGHQSQIGWRRNKIQELLITGYNQTEIANVLKISQPTVNRDIEFLREQARQNMQTHLQNRLPEEYKNCIGGINRILKMSWDIATKGLSKDTSNFNANSDADRTFSSTVDDRTRLQALALANDCYKYKMDLVTNGVVLTDAIKFVQQKKEELSKAKDNSRTTKDKDPESNSDRAKGSEIGNNNDPDQNTASNKVF